MLHSLRRELDSLAWIVRTLALVAVVAAVYKELQRPAEERTWQGRLLDTIPYDFRPPTPRRLAAAFWNPETDRLFNDQPFGVGWALNVPVLLRRIGLLPGDEPARAPKRSRRRSAA